MPSTVTIRNGEGFDRNGLLTGRSTSEEESDESEANAMLLGLISGTK